MKKKKKRQIEKKKYEEEKEEMEDIYENIGSSRNKIGFWKGVYRLAQTKTYKTRVLDIKVFAKKKHTKVYIYYRDAIL